MGSLRNPSTARHQKCKTRRSIKYITTKFEISNLKSENGDHENVRDVACGKQFSSRNKSKIGSMDKECQRHHKTCDKRWMFFEDKYFLMLHFQGYFFGVEKKTKINLFFSRWYHHVKFFDKLFHDYFTYDHNCHNIVFGTKQLFTTINFFNTNNSQIDGLAWSTMKFKLSTLKNWCWSLRYYCY